MLLCNFCFFKTPDQKEMIKNIYSKEYSFELYSDQNANLGADTNLFSYQYKLPELSYPPPGTERSKQETTNVLRPKEL